MADYCYQCYEKHLGGHGVDNDFVGVSTREDTEKSMYPVVLCEGCGPIQVNHLGHCVSKDCLDKHGTKGICPESICMLSDGPTLPGQPCKFAGEDKNGNFDCQPY